MQHYDRAFFQKLSESARRSARHIVPDVISRTGAKSVIDIGCGTGAWLSVFAENGIEDFLGIDSAAVATDMLEIPVERFVAFDLALPYRSSRRFDLVVSLEVAEHLPPAGAKTFVESLVRLGPAVLFSAAIPGQGGTHHVNEQWQDYWAGLFGKWDYLPIDFVRRTVWQNKEVAWWYAQNTILYCERSYALATPTLAREIEAVPAMPLAVVHPRKLQEASWHARLARGALELLRVMPPGSRFVLVDGAAAGDAFDSCGTAIPFPQKDGTFAGPPPDGQSAVAEMQHLLATATHVVILEPAFWWLTFYAEWSDFLRANSRAVLETDLMRVLEISLGGRAGSVR